ncbi:hypothetical protein [Halomonas sp. WWR20]
MSTLKGLVSMLLLIINTVVWDLPLYLLMAIKLITPTRRLRLHVLAGLNRIALAWIATITGGFGTGSVLRTAPVVALLGKSSEWHH